VAPLIDGIKAIRAARQSLSSTSAAALARADADFLLTIKEQEFTEAAIRAAGVVVDPLADAETVVAGGSIAVSVRVFLAQPAQASVASMTVKAPPSWAVKPAGDREAQGGRGRREVPSSSARYEVSVPATAPITQPYFLERPRQGDSYQWSQGSPKGAPFASPLLIGEVELTVGGVNLVASQPVEYRFADPIRGELRRPIAVVPEVTVGLDTTLLIVPLGNTPRAQRVVARVTSGSPAPVRGTVRLRIPPGWSLVPQEAPFALQSDGDQASAAFTLTAPANRRAGSVDIDAEARVGSSTYSQDIQVISYPHIQTHRLYWPAHARAQVVDLKVAPVKVGYIMGGGDEVPDAIRRMGIDVTMLDADMLATGDLSRFDTIVVGIRASETRPDFVANNRRLLQYVERGGTLIVQYQQSEYVEGNMAPYPVSQKGNPRVTDETAPVKMLAPTHPIFTFPNRITSADFTGWVQERNLYALSDFDRRYTPLLETADPGEPPQHGGQLYAEVGKGRYVYTAYAWFRQLPAGVPGAYRQFANLISLSKARR
jgi:hypothetical protein